MTFSITPYGILAYIPLILCEDGTYADLYWSTGDRRHALLCLTEDRDDCYLRSSHQCPVYSVRDPRIFVMRHPIDSGAYIIEGHRTSTSWQEILVRHRPPSQRLPGQLPDTRTAFVPPTPMQLALEAPFRFSEDRIQKFMEQSRSDSVQVRNGEFRYSHTSDSCRLPTSYVFVCDGGKSEESVNIVVKIGRCRETGVLSEAQPQPASDLWATVSRFASSDQSASDEADSLAHKCDEEHVSRWPNARMEFALHRVSIYYPATVTLSFTPCLINNGTLILDASFMHNR